MKNPLTLKAIAIACAFFCAVSCAEQSTAKFQLSEDEKREGYKTLFDGTNMDQWVGNTDGYVLKDGCIMLRPQGGSGNLYSKEKFANFILRFEFQLPPAGNNGLGIRHTIVDKGFSGMELQILDCEHPKYEKIKATQHHGSVYGYIPAKCGALKPAGEWNFQEVIANGNNIKITLNGTVILDCNLEEDTKHLDSKDIDKVLFNKTGHLAFMGHDDPVKFKNIRIKVLD